MTRIEELKKEIRNKMDEFRGAKSTDDKTKVFNAIKALESELRMEEELNGIDLGAAAPKADPVPAPQNEKVSVIHAMAKQVKNQPLSEGELQAIKNAVTGEDNIHIKELSTQIRELLRHKDYLKDLVTVQKTTAISGQFPVNATKHQGLVEVVDGVDMNADTNLQFDAVKFTIKKYGKLGLLNDTILKFTEADLISYMAQVFVDAYVYKINDMICETLVGKQGARKEGMKQVNTVKELVSATRLGLNRALKQDGAVILMTEETFDHFAKQENSKLDLSWVQPDLTKPAQPYFNGYPVRFVDPAHLKTGFVQSNEEVAATNSETADAVRHFFAFGNFKQALMLFENEEYTLSMSKEAGFLKNVVYSKIITYFDIATYDKDAWEVYYLSLIHI